MVELKTLTRGGTGPLMDSISTKYTGSAAVYMSAAGEKHAVNLV